MRRLDERNADFFEKLSIGLLVGAFVGDMPLYARSFLVALSLFGYVLMTLITVRSREKEHDDVDGDRS